MRAALAALTPIPALLLLVGAASSPSNSPVPAASPPTVADHALQTACPEPASVVDSLDGPMADVRYLSDDALEGREVATEGARCAAEYLAERFRAIGLEAPGPDDSYFQRFGIRGGAEIGSGSTLEISGADSPAANDWVPLGFSAAGSATAPLVYAGYGISQPSRTAPERSSPELEGRIAVVEHGDPAAPDDGSVHADPHFKASVAEGRGAVGVLILMDPGSELPDPASELRAPLDIPVAAVESAGAEPIREAARSGAQATLEADVTRLVREARNVVALLPGADPELRDEWVIVGAHYDHLGLGGQGSLAPDDYGTIHNGADDNASGTAAIVEAARILAEGPRPDRSVLFVAFTGEEKGLWGSSYYVRDPLHPLDRTVAMLNLDMVGRLGDDPLTVLGTGTAEEWTSVLDAANADLERPLAVSYVPDGYGASDHSSFYARDIPVLHFFTDTHADYHRPSDDWEKVDGEGMQRVSELVARVTRGLAGGAGERVADLTLVREDDTHAGSPPGGPDAASSGYGPYLGTVPDMTPSDSGVTLTGVRDGSPAEEAGMRAGDVVVEFGDREITDLYSYTYALQDHEAGDTVRIVVERDGERVPLTAVLGERR